jgi:AcrR family transcriptional regulator
MSALRKDAARNRDELLTAAQAAVAVHGPALTLSTVARAAHVGQATLYRHFPDRQALLLALMDRSLKRLEGFLTSHEEPDSLFLFLAFYIDHADEHAVLADFWRSMDKADPAVAETQARLDRLLARPVRRAIDAGLCRADLTVADLRLLLVMLNAVPGRDRSLDGSSVERMLAIVTTGLRR